MLLVVGVLIGGLVIVPSYVRNFEKFSDVYFELRKLKLVLFKDLIKKATNI